MVPVKEKKSCQTENCSINHDKIRKPSKKQDELYKVNEKSFKDRENCGRLQVVGADLEKR